MLVSWVPDSSRTNPSTITTDCCIAACGSRWDSVEICFQAADASPNSRSQRIRLSLCRSRAIRLGDLGAVKLARGDAAEAAATDAAIGAASASVDTGSNAVASLRAVSTLTFFKRKPLICSTCPNVAILKRFSGKGCSIQLKSRSTYMPGRSLSASIINSAGRASMAKKVFCRFTVENDSVQTNVMCDAGALPVSSKGLLRCRATGPTGHHSVATAASPRPTRSIRRI